eukprot:219094-Amphidinium_carterae.1
MSMRRRHLFGRRRSVCASTSCCQGIQFQTPLLCHPSHGSTAWAGGTYRQQKCRLSQLRAGDRRFLRWPAVGGAQEREQQATPCSARAASPQAPWQIILCQA